MMKYHPLTALGIAMISFLGIPVHAQNTLDPTSEINRFTSIGEWNTDGEQQGWGATNFASGSAAVASGLFNGVSGSPANNPNAVDPHINITPTPALDLTTGQHNVIEFRLRLGDGVAEFDPVRVDVFWGTDLTPGFAGVRRIQLDAASLAGWNDPAGSAADGLFHTFQVDMSGQPAWDGTLTHLRLDPIAGTVANGQSNQEFAFDYVRIGGIDVDTDEDGLADSVETDTGVFIDSTNTGTDPFEDDTDNDTFLDGVEVAFGTDPNDELDFPSPVLSYSATMPVYIRDLPITDNVPTVINGAPTGFAINPSLPAGLMLDTGTGIISGTPSALAPAAVYTVTATFQGAITDDFELTLQVADPGIVRYLVETAVYRPGEEITANVPTVSGPDPDLFSISQALPDGLFFDEVSGAITGTQSALTPATDYTVTASYASYPDSSYTISIQTPAAPVFLGTDLPSISTAASFGEWESDGDLEGWGFTNANGTVAGGILTYNATAPDPQMFRGGLAYDPAGGTIVEIRVAQNDTEAIQIFWGDGSGAGAYRFRRTDIPPNQLIGDGQFHTYQISFADAIVGDLVFLRIDSGADGGRSVEVDHIRIGTAAPPAEIKITSIDYDKLFNEVTLVWTSTNGTSYRVDASSDLTAWSQVATVTGDADSTTYIDGSLPMNPTRRYYRIVRLAP